MEGTRFNSSNSRTAEFWSPDFCVTKKFLHWGINRQLDSSVFGISVCIFGNIFASGVDFLGNASLAALTAGGIVIYPAYIVWRNIIIQLPMDATVTKTNGDKAYQVSVHVLRIFATIPQATLGSFFVLVGGLQDGLDFATTIGLAPQDPQIVRDISPKAPPSGVRQWFNGKLDEWKKYKERKFHEQMMLSAEEFIKAHPEYVERHKWRG